MSAPVFSIGDKFRRADYFDPKTYTIDKVRPWNNTTIYHAEGQGWAHGWAWIAEYNMKKVM